MHSSPHPKDAKPKEDETVNAIEVQTTEIVTKACVQALRQVIDNSDLGFDKQEFRHQKRVKCKLIGNGAKTAVTDKETYSVLSVLEAHSQLYWLGILLEFQFISEKALYRLASASLLVFRGEPNEPQKTALLRAEWDWKDIKGSSNHAQPHWHVYRSALNETAPQAQPITDEESEESIFLAADNTLHVKEEGWTKAADFHFAMASSWHVNATNSPKIQINDPQTLVNWMSGCITYTLGQLRFLYK